MQGVPEESERISTVVCGRARSITPRGAYVEALVDTFVPDRMGLLIAGEQDVTAGDDTLGVGDCSESRAEDV